MNQFYSNVLSVACKMKSRAPMLKLVKVILPPLPRVSVGFSPKFLWGMQRSSEGQFEESRLSSVIGIPWQPPNDWSHDSSVSSEN